MAEYYVATTAAGGGVGSEGDPFTLTEATTTALSGDTVWVKAGTYSDQSGATGAIMNFSATATPLWSMYTAYTTTTGDYTPGDAYPVILDASVNTLANCITASANPQSIIQGFRCTGGSGDGVELNGTEDALFFKYCRIDNHGGTGLHLDNTVSLLGCRVDNNGDRGLRSDSTSSVIGCIFHDNVSNDIYIGAGNGVVLDSLFYNGMNGTRVICTGGASMFSGNTVDGGGQASSKGFSQNGSSNIPVYIMNNIFFDLNIGLDVQSDRNYIRGHNMFSNVTTPYETLSVDVGDIVTATDPFTNSAGFDYTLKTGSEAIGTGLDAGVI